MNDPGQAPGPRTDRRLWLLGGTLLALVGVLAWTSAGFAPGGEEPLPLALGLLAAATVVWWLSVGQAFQPDKPLTLASILPCQAGKPDVLQPDLRIILGFALAFRLLLLFSWPIQEIDFYRYLWDGRVTLHALNPYHYSPHDIDEALLPGNPTTTAELTALANLSQQSHTVQTIFERVHYRDVPTAYPPAAQAAFATAALLAPATSSVATHVFVWKAVLLLFDLGTLALIVLLLRQLHLPPAWCIAYAWCPLVLKEYANSGHFDAVAVFFTVLAFVCLVRVQASGGRQPPEGEQTSDDSLPLRGLTPPARLRPAVLAFVALALAVLSKTYPIVLLPAFAAYAVSRFRWKALLPLTAFAAVLVASYLPVALDRSEERHTPGTGLGAFLSRWEMNDLVFMLTRENLRAPHAGERWFVVVPATLRTTLHADVLLPAATAWDLSPKADLALLAAQAVLGGVLAALGLFWAWQVYRRPEPLVLGRAIFLTLAWSWLLAAAANPWYLTWCWPFVVFAGARSWYLLPGLALLYYVRFWVARTAASGTLDVFDYGIVWLEYLPFFIALAVETCWQRASGGRQPPEGERASVASPALRGLTPPARLAGGVA